MKNQSYVYQIRGAFRIERLPGLFEEFDYFTYYADDQVAVALRMDLCVEKILGTTTFTAVMSCFNNIGPGLGNISPPNGNFVFFSQPSKLLLTFDMLLGRLEIYPILMIFAPGMWIRRKRMHVKSKDDSTVPLPEGTD